MSLGKTSTKKLIHKKGIKMGTKIVKGKLCGTCLLWGRKHAISSKTGALWPNASAPCMAEVDTPNDLPFSIQKVHTFCEDGSGCSLWDGVTQEMKVLTP